MFRSRKLAALEDQITFYRELLDAERKERKELQDLLFTKFGIIRDDTTKPLSNQIIRRRSWRDVRAEMERNSRIKESISK